MLAVIVLLDFPVERYKQSIEIRGLNDIVKDDISGGGFRVWRERERSDQMPSPIDLLRYV